MTWAVALAVGVAAAAGVYLALSRELFRCAIGVSLLGAAVNLLVFAAGRLGSTAPPVMAEGSTRLEGAANPLPQALVLTAIVIGFATTCFALVLVVRLVQALGTDDAHELRFAEPEAGHPYEPPFDEPDQADEPDKPDKPDRPGEHEPDAPSRGRA